MRKLISLMHVSLDGFCAGPAGEMNWITLNEAIFADAHRMIEGMGAAVYGRVTYAMMRNYWPTVLADDKADPAQRKHAGWVEQIPKFTFSRSMQGSDWNNVRLFSDAAAMKELKQGDGAPMLIFGSPSLVHAFLAMDLIDEFWIFLNPVLLGKGVPYFKDAPRTKLKLADTRAFDGGVMRLHHVKDQA